MQGGLIEIYSNTFSSSTNQLQFDLRPGMYEKLIFRFSGTSDTAQTFDPTDVGELDINDGSPLARVPFSVLDDLAQMKGGIMERAAATAGATDFYIPYRFHWFTDRESVFVVRPGQTVRAKMLFAANLATTFGANDVTLNVYAIFRTGVMPYKVRYTRHDIAIASGTRSREILPEDNVIAAYVENTTNISRLWYFQDGEALVDTQRDALISLSHDDNQLETYSATFPLLEINLNRTDKLTDIKNDSNIIELEGSGTDTITVTVVSIQYTPIELQASILNRQQIVSAKRAQKLNRGKVEEVQVEEILQRAS